MPTGPGPVQTDVRVLRARWLIFAVLAAAYLFVYFHRLSLSVVADELVRAFGATAGQVGLLGSLYFYCYAVMQFPAGLLSDSLGPRRTVTGFLMIASAGSVLFGLAPGLNTAFLGRILVGLGVSMVFIPTMKILSQWYRAREFASMAGILNAVGGGGVLAATWLLARLTAVLGWRASFVWIGGITFVLVGLVWFVVRDRPEDRGWPPVIDPDAANGSGGPCASSIGLWEGARLVVSEKHFWPVAIWFFLDCAVFFGFGGLWGGPYLMHVYGMTRQEAGGLLSMIAWGMILGSPALGYLSDCVLRSRKRVFMLSSGLLAALFAFLVAFPSGLPAPVLYLVFFGFSVFASAVVVVGFTTTKELFPVQIAGTSVGTVNLFPFLGGAVSMPLLGKVLDAYPRAPGGAYAPEAYETLLAVLLGASVLAALCTLLMRETHPERRGASPA